MIEKYTEFLKDLQENPNIEIEDHLTKEYKPLSDFVIDFTIENLEEEGYTLDDKARQLLHICDAKIGWESTLENVDYVCTGGAF